MNNREKAKAVQKKFNQRLGIYYGVMAAGVIVAAIGLMTQINVLTLLGVVAFFADQGQAVLCIGIDQVF